MALDTLDPESAEWLRQLGVTPRDAVEERLHAMLVRVARSEARRRWASIPERGREEVDDLCIQAASDALLAVLRKLGDYRGASRFTTWAAKFVIFEFSTRLRRHSWRHRRVDSSPLTWEELATRAPSALAELQHSELMTRLGQLVEETLTERQQRVFVAAVIEEVPIDVLAEQLESTRGAVYKILHDARQKLRRGLIAAGFEELHR